MRALRLAWIPVVVLLLSIPAAEVAFRVAGLRVGKGAEAAYVAVEHGAYRLRPNHVAEMPWYPETYTVETNALGFRVHEGDEGWTPAEGPLDILLAGDSLVVGSRIGYERSFAGIFTRRAEQAGLTVANMAVNGHYIVNQVSMLRWLHGTHDVRPRVIVLGVTVYGIGSIGSTHEPHVENGVLWSRPPTSLMLAKTWVSQNFATYSVLRNASKELMHRGMSSGRVIAYCAPYLAEREEVLAAVLREVHEISGARVVVVYYPDSYFMRVSDVDPAASSDHVAALIKRAAEASGARFVDMRPPLRELVEAGESLGMIDDPHYTPHANAAVGTALWGAQDWRALARD